MKTEGKPVPSKEKLEKLARAFEAAGVTAPVDFNNTEIAFEDKSDKELRKTYRLFKMMNNPTLVKIGSVLGMLGARYWLPFFETAVRNTIFWQFCGGTTLLDSQESIARLYKHGVFSVLDYGAEGKETEEDFNQTMVEIIRAIEFGSQNEAVPVVSVKMTGLARFDLLDRVSNTEELSPEEQEEYKNVLKRIDSICHNAASKGLSVFIDAEESWIQPAIDHLTNQMMERYNKERVVVYNTFQLYRTDRLQYLMNSYDDSRKKGYLLGAKLVRGAYMDKEREQAAEKGYPSPIHPNKAATDHDYNLAIRFCIENYEHIALCNATHNSESNYLMASLIDEKKLPKDHPHLNFCQLYGMSDNITFNLAKAGYNVAKYVVYGPVRTVIPYLIRRTQENTSVTGDMSRELALVTTEMKRRGLLK
ncbi:MAG: proline dehydrogenase family protein [Saprospiraceae bacterium]